MHVSTILAILPEKPRDRTSRAAKWSEVVDPKRASGRGSPRLAATLPSWRCKVSELGTYLSIWVHPDDDAFVHHWTLEAVRRSGIGALHVSVNTQESLDQNLAGFVELVVTRE